MKVFISSVITGFEAYREASSQAVHHVRQTYGVAIEPVRVEVDYPSMPTSSQQACMAGVSSCDIYVLLLGARYGWESPRTGLSATHEEYEEALRNGKPILAFIEDVTPREPKQQAFVDQVENYNTGVFRRRFKGTDALRLEVEHAVVAQLHRVGVTVAGFPDNSKFTQLITNHGRDPVIIQHVQTLNLDRRPKP